MGHLLLSGNLLGYDTLCLPAAGVFLQQKSENGLTIPHGAVQYLAKPLDRGYSEMATWKPSQILSALGPIMLRTGLVGLAVGSGLTYLFCALFLQPTDYVFFTPSYFQ